MKFCLVLFIIIFVLVSCDDKNNSDDNLVPANVTLNNPINKFAFDSAGNKWYGNYSGLYFIQGNKLLKVEIGSSVLHINSLVFNDSSLWAATSNGVVKLRIETNNKVSILSGFDTSNCSIASNLVYTMGFDSRNRIWFGTSKGISMFDGTTWKKNKEIQKNLVIVSGREVTGIAFREKDCHLTTNGKNLLRVMFAPETDAVSGASQLIGGGDVEGTNYNGDFTTDTILCVSAGRDTAIWFGSAKGLTCNRGSNHAGSPGAFFDYFLAGQKVNTVLETLDGKVWAGTENGIYFKSGSTWTNYNTTNGLNSNVVLSLAEGVDRSIWIETDKGVSQFIDNKFVNCIVE